MYVSNAQAAGLPAGPDPDKQSEAGDVKEPEAGDASKPEAEAAPSSKKPEAGLDTKHGKKRIAEAGANKKTVKKHKKQA